MSESQAAGDTDTVQRGDGATAALFHGTVHSAKTPFFSDTE